MAQITLDAIKEIASKKGNALLQTQINAKSPIVQALKSEGLDGSTYVINVQGGGLSSVGMVADHGALPSPDASGAEQIQVRPVSLFANIAVGQLAAKTLTGKMDSVKLVENQFKLAGDNLSHTLGVALFGKRISGATGNATVSAGALTLAVDDAARYRRGMSYTWIDNGTAVANKLVCKSVVTASDGSGTVVFDTAATGTFDAAQDYVAVANIQSHWCSLDEAAGSGTIYGTAISDAEWAGNTITASGVLTNPLVREMSTLTVERAGEMPDLYFMSPRQFQAYEDLQLANRRFMDSSYDPFGKNADAPKIQDKGVVIDPTCFNHKVFSVVRDDVRLGKFQDFKEYNQFQNSTSHYEHILQMDGLFNLLVDKRASVTKLEGLSLDLHAA